MRLILKLKVSGLIHWLAVECEAINKKLYRAVDKYGNTIDFRLSTKRDEAAARKFFQKAINHNNVPERVVIDKSGANLAGLEKINTKLKFTNAGKIIEILRVKYLNNVVEQDHRFIKKIVPPIRVC